MVNLEHYDQNGPLLQFLLERLQQVLGRGTRHIRQIHLDPCLFEQGQKTWVED
jgi:hypothetical protein